MLLLVTIRGVLHPTHPFVGCVHYNSGVFLASIEVMIQNLRNEVPYSEVTPVGVNIRIGCGEAWKSVMPNILHQAL